MFGFMLPTWFLSMWVSNTATTAMMIPIVGAVMEQMKEINEPKGITFNFGKHWNTFIIVKSLFMDI